MRRHQAGDALREDAALFAFCERLCDDLGEAEDAERDRHEADAVGKLGDAEREALLARVDVGADQAEEQPDEDHRDGLHDAALRQHDRRDQAKHHQREVFRRSETLRDAVEGQPEHTAIRTVAKVPAMNEPMAAMASAAPARPCRAI